MSKKANPILTRSFRETLWEQLADPAFRREFAREFVRYMKSGDTEMLKVMGREIVAWADHNPGDPPIETGTDWDLVNAMTDEEVHAAALSDPDAQPIPAGTDGELAKIGLHRIVNTRRLRDRIGLTQEEFASRYRIPMGTLRDWEQGRKFPDAPARAYLLVIAKDPAGVARLLGESAA